jgi:hypothetical protein
VSKIASLGIVALILATTATTAKPDITLYQLQKNCEQTAAETFRRESGNDEDRDYYRAHYDANLNICFYVEALRSFSPKGISRWVYLYDLGTKRIYGGLHSSTNIGLFYCGVGNKECHSEAEWYELLRPYTGGIREEAQINKELPLEECAN